MCPSTRRDDRSEEDHSGYYQEVQGARDDWTFGRVRRQPKLTAEVLALVEAKCEDDETTAVHLVEISEPSIRKR